MNLALKKRTHLPWLTDLSRIWYYYVFCMNEYIYIYTYMYMIDWLDCRLGFIVDFLSHATIVGFMAGAATVVCLQQLKGILGLNHFTHETDVVSVLRSVFSQTHEVGCLVPFLPFLSRAKLIKLPFFMFNLSHQVLFWDTLNFC